jgi:SAM-dependent methyltransferase
MTDVNYRYFVHYVVERADAARLRILDFGCGGGELVGLLLAQGMDAYGADVFYAGAGFDALRSSAAFRDGRIRSMPDDGSLPFDDRCFDLIVSNQVFEHVPVLRPVVDELDRVLRDDGLMYHHFPSREVIREGHIGIPLAHRLPRGRLRREYVRALRAAGLGSHKDDVPAGAWSQKMLDWLDAYTHYRPYREVVAEFGRLFELRHREIDYCRFRSAGSGPVVRRLLAIEKLTPLWEASFRRLAFMALEMRKKRGPLT